MLVLFGLKRDDPKPRKYVWFSFLFSVIQLTTSGTEMTPSEMT